MGPMRVIASIFLLIVTYNANAERWIVKNAKSVPPNMKVIKQIEFGPESFTVVEVDENAMSLMALTQSDAAFPDAKIGLVTEQPVSDSGQEGWHISRTKYDQVPSGIDGKGVIVAVIDSGVDYSHPALVNHMWKNTAEIPGNGIDDDHNGLVDDYDGYDFVDHDSNPMDELSHGTHCAGIIAADKNAAGTARGVAPGVKIMPLRIIGKANTGFLSDAADAIKYASDHGARVLSNSWRVYKSWSNYFDQKAVDVLFTSIKYAENKGVIFVNAAGNETKNIDTDADPIFPSGMEGLPNLFVVAATEFKDQVADYSNFGPRHVRVAAPGSDILSTVPNNKWSVMSGTSMATPLVAGVLALGLQHGYSAEQAMSKLISTSTPVAGFDGIAESRGIIDIQKYLQ